MNTALPQEDTSTNLVPKTIAINILIFFLVIMKTNSEWIAIIGGFAIIMYIFLKAFSNPKDAIFLLFGIKLTFDALWDVKIFEHAAIGKIGLLDLIIIPILFLIFFGKKISYTVPKWPSRLLIVYLAWVCFAMVINDESSVNLNLFIKQSCILFGLLLGLKYIETIEDFQTIIHLIFLSTIIPILGSFLQSIAGSYLNLPFLHYTMDNLRESRIAGFYYDAATMGMVVIISLLSNFYLLQKDLIKGNLIIFYFVFLFVCMYVAILGGTRSIIFISFAVVALSLIANPKRMMLLIPLIFILIILSQSYIDNILLQINKEGLQQAQLSGIMSSNESKYLFSGRVGIWQDIWEISQNSTPLQQIFGTGLSPAYAHSSYFFLILQIGWLGLSYYLIYCLLIVKCLMGLNIPKYLLLISIGVMAGNLLMGISAVTVIYSSFQLFIFLVIGASISIGNANLSEGTYSESESNELMSTKVVI